MITQAFACTGKQWDRAHGGIIGVSVQGQELDLLIPVGPFELRRFCDSEVKPLPKPRESELIYH